LHHLYDQLKEKSDFSFEPRHILGAAIGLAVFGAAMLYSGILLSERGGVGTNPKAPVSLSIQSQSPSFVAKADPTNNKGGEPELVHVGNLGAAIPARVPKRAAKKKNSEGMSRVLRAVGPVPVPEEEKVAPPKAPKAEALIPARKVELAVASPLRQVHRTLFRRASSGGEAIARGTNYARNSVQKGATELAHETGDYRNALRKSLGRALDRTAENYVPEEPVKEEPKPQPAVAKLPKPAKAVAVLPKVMVPKPKPVAKPKPVVKAKAKPKVVKPAPSNRNYTIQIHAFKDKGTASEVANVIGSFKGKAAKIRTQQREGVTWYRVQIGSFNNLAEARSFQKSFEVQKGLANTFLVAR